MKIVKRKDNEDNITASRLGDFIGKKPEKLGKMGSLEGITYHTPKSTKKLKESVKKLMNDIFKTTKI